MHKEMPFLVINMNKGDVVMHEDQVSRWLILAAFSAVDVKVILIYLRPGRLSRTCYALKANSTWSEHHFAGVYCYQ